MANFTTHIGAGTVVSGALATLTLAADVVAPENLVAVTMAGVLGSVLPDIDLKESRPSRAMFAGLAVFLSFAVLFTLATKYSIAELWIVWLGTLVGVRYGVHTVFHKLSVHRGIWHSLLAAAFCSVITAIVFYRLLGRPDGVAWLAGGFMFIGYLTHLVLDEIYSVDVMDVRIKSSFGTAVKLVDTRYIPASLAMAAAMAVAVYFSPPTKTFVDGIGSKSLWAGLQHRLLPGEKWFGLIDFHKIANVRQVGADITTGSIAKPAVAVTPAPASAAATVPEAELDAAPQSQPEQPAR